MKPMFSFRTRLAGPPPDPTAAQALDALVEVSSNLAAIAAHQAALAEHQMTVARGMVAVASGGMRRNAAVLDARIPAAMKVTARPATPALPPGTVLHAGPGATETVGWCPGCARTRASTTKSCPDCASTLDATRC
jgi:hypothetical protein